MIRCDWLRTVSYACIAMIVTACGGGGGDDGGGSPPPPPTTFTVGGTITGLTQSSVTLRLNGANDLVVNSTASGSASFTFSGAPIASGASYTVSVALQPNSTATPAALVCGPAVTNGSGTMGSANVTSLVLACASYSIGGTLSGLKAGSELRLMITGDARQHSLMANGAFTLPASATFGIGIAYLVHIMNQPAGQTCLIEGSLGVIRQVDPNVSTIAIVCDDNVTDALSGTYKITEVNGESSEDLELRDFISFYADGTFIFGIHEGSNPDCGPNGQGGLQYGIYNWDDTTHVFTVVRLIRYSGTALLECGLDDNDVVKLVKRGDGSLLFVDETDGDSVVLTPVPSTAGELIGSFGDNQFFTAFAPDGTFFNADTRAFPASQIAGNPVGFEDGCYTLSTASRVTGSFTVNVTATCAVSGTQTAVDLNGAGWGMSPFSTQGRNFTVTGDTVEFVAVQGQGAIFRAARIPVAPTAASTFSISGTISGLTGASGTTLRLNGQTGSEFNLFRPALATTFAFSPRLESGAAYTVAVPPHAHPTGPTQFCRATAAGAGTILASDVTDVVITCSNSASYTVSGNVTGLAGGAQLTLRARYFDPAAGGEGAFAMVDRVASANGAYGAIAIPANVGVFIGILQQPAGQTCTIVRGTGFTPGVAPAPTAITNVDVTCLNNVTGPLSGTYSFLDTDGREYLNFNADGTLTTVLLHRDPDPANTAPPADCTIGIPAIDQRHGNGVEYGIFSWNQASGATQIFAPPAIDTNGDCGFWDPNVAPANPWAIITRVGNTVQLQSPPGSADPFSATATAVQSVPGSLVGGWVPVANDGMVLVFHADGTFMLAETQNGFLFPAGYGQERGCYTVTGSNIALTIAAGCRPDGFAAYDLNATGGVFPNGATITVTKTVPLAFTLNGDTLEFLGRAFRRTQPN